MYVETRIPLLCMPVAKTCTVHCVDTVPEGCAFDSARRQKRAARRVKNVVMIILNVCESVSGECLKVSATDAAVI